MSVIWCGVCGKDDTVPHTPIDHPWLVKGHRLIPKPKVDEMVAIAVADERARIRAAVEGLPVTEPCGGWGCSGGYDDRAAVLAAIDGETT